MHYHKFVKWDAPPVETLFDTTAVKAMIEADNGNTKPIKELYSNNGDITLLDGAIRRAGWEFDLRPYCKKFWVKTKWYGIREYYAPNKTSVRKILGSHNVLEIVEVA